MKLLYPGCRARLIYLRKGDPCLAGKEVTITEKAPPNSHIFDLPYEWICRIHGFSIPGYFTSDQLEPIVPEGLLEEETQEELEEQCV